MRPDEVYAILSKKIEMSGYINVPNSAQNNGYVPKGEGHPNQVWKTDKDGNPGWRPESKGFYVTFADGTWAEIKTMLDLHYAGEIDIADYWAVGDEKTITVSAMAADGVNESHAEQEVTLVITGINHDDLNTAINGISKAAITIGLKNSLKEKGYMNSTSTNTGDWSESKRRTWCNNIFYAALPPNLKTLIKAVDKKIKSTKQNNYQGYVTNDLCWLPSATETNFYTNEALYAEGDTYEYYKTESNRIKTINNSNSDWWIRSVNWNKDNSFLDINLNGGIGSFYSNASLGLAPHFCI